MIHLLRGLCLALLALAWANPSFAQREDVPRNICQGLGNIPTGLCFQDAYEKEKSTLKSLIPQIEQLIDPQGRAKLLLSEKAWRSYRDYICDVESELYFDGGTGHGTEVETCLFVETNLHIKDLHAIYDWAMRPR